MEELQRIAGELNKRLQDIGEELLLIEEAVALTLYTGPMFEKHYSPMVGVACGAYRGS